jgi:hypothetical protein
VVVVAVEMVQHHFYGYTAIVVNHTMMTTCDVNYYDDHDLNVVAIWIYVLTSPGAAGTARAVEIEATPAPAGVVIVVVLYPVIPIAHSATVVD